MVQTRSQTGKQTNKPIYYSEPPKATKPATKRKRKNDPEKGEKKENSKKAKKDKKNNNAKAAVEEAAGAIPDTVSNVVDAVTSTVGEAATTLKDAATNQPSSAKVPKVPSAAKEDKSPLKSGPSTIKIDPPSTNKDKEASTPTEAKMTTLPGAGSKNIDELFEDQNEPAEASSTDERTESKEKERINPFKGISTGKKTYTSIDDALKEFCESGGSNLQYLPQATSELTQQCVQGSSTNPYDALRTYFRCFQQAKEQAKAPDPSLSHNLEQLFNKTFSNRTCTMPHIRHSSTLSGLSSSKIKLTGSGVLNLGSPGSPFDINSAHDCPSKLLDSGPTTALHDRSTHAVTPKYSPTSPHTSSSTGKPTISPPSYSRLTQVGPGPKLYDPTETSPASEHNPFAASIYMGSSYSPTASSLGMTTYSPPSPRYATKPVNWGSLSGKNPSEGNTRKAVYNPSMGITGPQGPSYSPTSPGFVSKPVLWGSPFEAKPSERKTEGAKIGPNNLFGNKSLDPRKDSEPSDANGSPVRGLDA
ncbi:hypothetical protein NA57DRAFT_55270 [Rhizodiscina lignyota]|uniref:Uncharacterized protein n=1 Tax=Rhizodiscina lignyota TaxID=1504668 RepID=A0A9P4M9F0_9PEZI|nr:hypothetical protein NA57DRAFT_55270 [Rhizodiscina lignyota]